HPEIAGGMAEDGAAGHTEQSHHFQDRKTRSRVLRFGLGKSGLVFWSVRQPGGGAVQGFESAALQMVCPWRPTEGRLSDVDINSLQQTREDELARLAVGRAVFINGPAMQREKHGHLFQHFPAGGVALKDLPQPAPKGAVQRQEPLAAVIFGSLIVQAPRRQDRSQACFNLGEGPLAERFQGFFDGTGAHGSKHWHPLREVTCHITVYIPPYVDRCDTILLQ
ncbi:MAG: hypothetical protein JWM99_2513, partial [Verrucomicrobiales bacterium]|nr:hypothetical protein [Verrucomicrobiales bacterium]